MKNLRFTVLTSLAVFLFLLSANLAPPAEAGGLPGTGCPAVHYRIARGDTLTTIAWRYGVTVGQLQQWNGIANSDRIYWGNVLTIYPARCPAPAPRPAPKPAPVQQGAPVTVISPVTQYPASITVIGSGPIPCTGVCPVTPAVSCADQRAVISSPAPNSVVSGWLTIKGNATHENFKFYKLEYGAGSEPTTWSWFFGGEWPIWQGTLGGVNTGLLPSGTYTIRLSVVDKTSNYPPPCEVTIVVR